MPPPIRYPLPTLVVLLIVSLAFWRGDALTRSLRATLAARLARAVEGPPIPRSDRPQVVAGPIIRRALLLHDDLPAADRPGGPPLETIRHRMFVDVFDVWPIDGEPTQERVGNRRPIGWVRAADLLPWDTRLVVRSTEGVLPLADGPDLVSPRPNRVGRSSLPVLAWTQEALRVAAWEPGHPWSEVDRRAWVRSSEVGREGWGVWLSREELLALIRRTLVPDAPEMSRRIRLRAILGRLLDDRALSDDDLRAAFDSLPAQAFLIAAASPAEASDRLARANESWSAEASWGGLSFQFIPLESLP